MKLDLSASPKLLDQVKHESVRYTIEHVFRTQLTTPLGWLLVMGLVWSRVPVGRTLVWTAGFAALLAFILARLWQLRRTQESPGRRVVWLHALAALDGLAWGLLPFFAFGVDAVLDTWLVTLLCGVAAVNGPPRALLPGAYRAQLLALWLPMAVFAALHRHQQGVFQMIAGVAVYLVLLWSYVRGVTRVMRHNILLRLRNAELSAQLQQTLRQVEREAATDPLTEQPNRRELNRVLAEVDRRRHITGDTYSLLMLDIDHFKQINDRHGHDVGDQVLKAFARRVCESLRPDDVLARTGGEEFTVLLRGASVDDAMATAQRICHAVAATPLPTSPPLRITVSIGVAEHRGQQTPAEVAKACDVAVYQAKQNGRNRVSAAAAA